MRQRKGIIGQAIKKSALICLAVLPAAVLLTAAGIQVTRPAGGETVTRGADYQIRWNSPVPGQGAVLIRLFKAAGMAKVGTIVTSAPNTGQFLWKKNQIQSLPPAEYVIRVKTLNNQYSGDSAPFQLKADKDPAFGIIEAEQLKTLPPTQPHRHRAPPLKEPEGASFEIMDIHYGVSPQGQFQVVGMIVKYQSKTSFSFQRYPGHSQDGPIYMNCKIVNPQWPGSEKYGIFPAEKGPPEPVVIFNHRLSIKYGGKNHLECAQHVINAGNGEFELIFTPALSKPLLGLNTIKNMKGAGFSNPDVCERIYPPKMAVRLFIHTKEGVKTLYKEFYLLNTPRKSFKIPGELSICSGGIQSW
ncbi:MAG: hypothetical protein JXA62_08705 [Candidatus Aminicenantes bacterium]|nr:hypothetical protein [Candidatus Aminicenantes bacterium]